MAFMISRETENVKSSEEIESAFRALSSEGKPYVTKEELYQVRPRVGQGMSCIQLEQKATGPIMSLPCAECGGVSPHTQPCGSKYRVCSENWPPPTPAQLRLTGGLSRLHLSLQNLTREQADYCVSHMKPYVDGKGRELPTAFDYVEFTRSLFVN